MRRRNLANTAGCVTSSTSANSRSVHPARVVATLILAELADG